MRWLITGGRGFTGRHLLPVLSARGDEIATLGRAADDDAKCDLADASAVAAAVRAIRPDRVIHLAGISSVTHSQTEDFRRINVDGAENLLRACAALPSPPVVALASSCNVYGIRPGLIAETAEPLPVSAYGQSKLQMEQVAARWADRLPLLVARPFNYTGPGQPERFLVPKIAAHFRRRAPVIELGDIDVARDFSDVRDIVDDYLALLDGGVVGETVNLCGGRATSVRSILEVFVTLTGHRPEVRRDPALVRAHEIPSLAGDPAKLIRLTGRAHRLPLERTLADLLAS